MISSRLDSMREDRLKKLEKLQELGINPYPAKYSMTTEKISVARKSLNKKVAVLGRLWRIREHGNVMFTDIKDSTGQIQVLFQKKNLNDKFKIVKLLDSGDFIGVSGKIIKTVAGETTIDADSFEMLSKSLRPIPNEWSGLKNVEERYRKRYLDLLLDENVRKRFQIRTKLLKEVRNYLDDLGFEEVETPIFHPLYGGANARPFMSHMNALDVDFYLRIAFELYLKKLIIGGYEKVYEIGRDFRNEGIDHSHNPEFTMIEWYEINADYQKVMDVTEGLFKYLAKAIFVDTKIKVDKHTVNIDRPWPRITMERLIKERLGINLESNKVEDLERYCHKNDIELVGGETKGQIIFEIFDKKISKTLVEPTWVIDYPSDVSPLSKPHRSKSGWAERFEGYIGGREICDGWSELTNPLVQRERWEFDIKASRKDKTEAQHIDEDFLEAMEYGMPPLGGIGIGIDRLVMFFTNTWSLKEVILFPTLRPSDHK